MIHARNRILSTCLKLRLWRVYKWGNYLRYKVSCIYMYLYMISFPAHSVNIYIYRHIYIITLTMENNWHKNGKEISILTMAVEVALWVCISFYLSYPFLYFPKKTKTFHFKFIFLKLWTKKYVTEGEDQSHLCHHMCRWPQGSYVTFLPPSLPHPSSLPPISVMSV